MKPKKKKPGEQKRPEAAVKALKMAFSSDTGAFPVVGIGASAGGLEALESFFSQVPAGCNMAFVVIQHLDPTH